MSLSTAWAVVKAAAVTHAPVIFIGAAAIGVISTAVIAWKAGRKAPKVLGEAKYAKGSELTKVEKVKATWKLWVPVIVSIILTFGCMGASYYIHSVRLANMTATANALLASNKELRQQLDDISVIDPDTVKEVQDKHLTDFARRSLESYDDGEVYRTGHGDQLFFDAFLGTKFYSSTNDVLAGIARFQQRYRTSIKGVTIDDLYDCLDIMKEGTASVCLEWPKRGLNDFDESDVPDIMVSKQTLYQEDRFTGEFTDEYEEVVILSYFPYAFSGRYALSGDNCYRSVGNRDMTDLANRV